MNPLPNILRKVEKAPTLIEGLRALLLGARENCRNEKDARVIDDLLMNLDAITAALQRNLK